MHANFDKNFKKFILSFTSFLKFSETSLSYYITHPKLFDHFYEYHFETYLSRVL